MPKASCPSRLRRSAIGLVAGALALTTVLATSESAQAAQPANKISAYFVSPRPTQAANEAIYKAMKTDAIVVGGRVNPVDSTVPATVRSAMSGTRLYYDTPINLPSSQIAKTVKSGSTTWGIVKVSSGTVAVKIGVANVDHLVKAGNTLKAGTWVGVPRPAKRTDVPWFPNVAYQSQLAGFTKIYTAHYKAMGAEGVYQGFEMPITDTAYWQPVRNLYSAQNTAINSAWPKAPVIISPYLESRKAKAYFTPTQAANGAKKIMATANGTRIILAPQDGYGTGTTCVKGASCSSKHYATAETYWTAMNKAVPTLWNNAETMRPDPKDPTKRVKASASLISAQLARIHTKGGGFDGSISWSWNYAPGGAEVSGITDFSNGFAKTGK